jgi:hypothetical protein
MYNVEYGDRKEGGLDILYFPPNVDSQEKPTAIVLNIAHCTGIAALHPPESWGALVDCRIEESIALRNSDPPYIPPPPEIRAARQGHPGGHPPQSCPAKQRE